MPFDTSYYLRPLAFVVFVFFVFVFIRFTFAALRDLKEHIGNIVVNILKIVFASVFLVVIVASLVGTVYLYAWYNDPNSFVASQNERSFLYKAVKFVKERRNTQAGETARKQEGSTPKPASKAEKGIPYPIRSLREKGILNYKKFEIITRGDVKVVFFDIDGKVVSHTARVVDDRDDIIIYTPDKSEAYAVAFPVVNDGECEYQTKDTGGEFVPCRKDGPPRFGMEKWGFRFAYFDSK